MPAGLDIQPLSRDAFAPFGDVIEISGAKHYAINEGAAERYHDLARIETDTENGRPLINIFRGQPRPHPIEIKMLERHPLGSQAFYPLQPHDYLVVVAPQGEAPTADSLHAFRAHGRQGVNYRPNVWHHPLLVLIENHDFLVIDRGGPEENCEEYFFSESDLPISLKI